MDLNELLAEAEQRAGIEPLQIRLTAAGGKVQQLFRIDQTTEAMRWVARKGYQYGKPVTLAFGRYTASGWTTVAPERVFRIPPGTMN